MLLYFVDTETAGLSLNDPVLTLAIVGVNQNFVIKYKKEFNLYQKGYYNTSSAYEVNKIDIEEHKKYEQDFEKNIREIFLKLNNSIVTAYNSNFDLPRIKKIYEDRGMNLRFANSFDMMPWCTRKHSPDGKRKKLMEIVDILKLDIDNIKQRNSLEGDYHNALFDTILLKEVAFRTLPIPLNFEEILGWR